MQELFFLVEKLRDSFSLISFIAALAFFYGIAKILSRYVKNEITEPLKQDLEESFKNAKHDINSNCEKIDFKISRLDEKLEDHKQEIEKIKNRIYK